MQTFESPDGKRIVTVGTTEPDRLNYSWLRHVVTATLNGAPRVWQVSSREQARIIVRAYKRRGQVATYVAPSKV
jgi:hypothetical protein